MCSFVKYRASVVSMTIKEHKMVLNDIYHVGPRPDLGWIWFLSRKGDWYAFYRKNDCRKKLNQGLAFVLRLH